MHIENLGNIGHLREIAQEVDDKLKTGDKVQQATNSVIEKTLLLKCKIFSMIRKIFSPKRNVQFWGNDQPKLLDFKRGFRLDPTNAKSFGDSLKTNGAKFIVNQLTDKEIFGLINSEFLSIPQKLQICEAYKGRNKVRLEYLLAEALNKKLAPLGFNEDTTAKFFGTLPDSQKFSDYMLDIFANTSPRDFPDVLEFYFGPGGILPLQDLPKEHQEALLKSILSLGENMERLISQKDPQLKQFIDAGEKMVQCLGLKYALEEILGKSSEQEIQEELTVIRNCVKTGQFVHLLKSDFYDGFTKACMNFLNNPPKNYSYNSDILQRIISDVNFIFESTTTKATPTEMALFQIFDQAINEGKVLDWNGHENIIPEGVEQLCKNWVLKMESSNTEKRTDSILEFIQFSMKKELDPTPVLSLYPKTTLEVFRETFEEIRYSDSQRTPEAFFAKINILIEIGSRAKDIFPLPPVSKVFSDAESYRHFLGNSQTLLDKLLEFREEYNMSSNKNEVYKKGRDWVSKEINALQGTIRMFESLCEDANRTV
ncbi:MAG: hypothetical protein ACSW8C_00595 [bacterium]